MGLNPNTKLGPYEILSPLGAGGMGEVYRARDSRLDREVAIKVLPEALARDRERILRFEREAKVLAPLNHPNIAAIYGFEEFEGQRFLVMELAEGETLAERLDRGPIPMREALEMANGIAIALEAAHEKGIIHRDLKPANVKVTPDGTTKVLDFGLAKAMTGDSTGTDIANSPTITMEHTRPGVVLGTAAYMSPEQARGRPLDKRTDIWSFGAVLYECLTGTRPFLGETTSDLVARILEREPDWSTLPAGTPPLVRLLLRRCLAKDRNKRLRDIGDARIELEETLQRLESGESDVAHKPFAKRFSRFWPVLTALLVVALGLSLMRTSSAVQRVSGSRSAAFRQVTDLPGQERQPSLSPDGKSVVYTSKSGGNPDIFLQRVGGRTPINLTADSLEDDSSPAFSPNGESIAFRSERGGGGVFVMGATGESIRRVTDFGYDPAWSPDGSRLALTTERVDDPLNREGISELWIVTLDGSEKRRLTEGDAVDANWSPDGRRIAYWGWREPDWQRDIWTIAVDGSEPRGVLVTDDPPVDWCPVWTSDGRSLYFGSNRGGTMNLWRIEVDSHSGLPGGSPVPVTTPSPWSGSFSLSADGKRLVYATRDEQTSVMTVGFDPEAGALVGEPKRIFGGRALLELDWSPDGERLILTQRGDPWESMAIIRADGTGYTRITDASIQHRNPRWRPIEGSDRILIYSNTSVKSLRSDGSDLKPIGEGQHSAQAAWSVDGRSVLALLQNEQWRASALQRFDVDQDGIANRAAWASVAIEGRGIGWLGDWSRDGARALFSGQFPDHGLHVVDLGTGESRKLADYATVFPGARWLPDGRRAVVRVSNQIFLLDVETLERKPLLEAGSESSGTWMGALSLTRDGRKLAYLVPQGEGDVWLMDLTGARD